ncbi:MAG: hypothetical protein IJJ56_04500 [Prevotella sp.]|nr:hypothetical protein [Prevotella sp.]
MGTFKVTSSNSNNQYEYKDNVVVVIGNYNTDNTTSTLQNVSGTVCQQNQDGEQGEYIGNFNGYMRDGEIRYSLSEMSRRDSNKVWDAIDEIEPYVTGQNANDGEE